MIRPLHWTLVGLTGFDLKSSKCSVEVKVDLYFCNFVYANQKLRLDEIESF